MIKIEGSINGQGLTIDGSNDAFLRLILREIRRYHDNGITHLPIDVLTQLNLIGPFIHLRIYAGPSRVTALGVKFEVTAVSDSEHLSAVAIGEAQKVHRVILGTWDGHGIGVEGYRELTFEEAILTTDLAVTQTQKRLHLQIQLYLLYQIVRYSIKYIIPLMRI